MTYKLDNIEITDTQLDELIAQRKATKFEYPLFKRWKTSGEIVKFTALQKGTLLVGQGVGNTANTFISHTDYSWEDIPYNKERDLFHTQAIECWEDDDTHSRILRFYDAINDCTFAWNGTLNGAYRNNYKAIPLDKVPDWMNKARATLEK